MKNKLIFAALLTGSFLIASAQVTTKPEETEYYTPVPKIVTPGKSCGDAPSDAIILFDGVNLDQWVLTNDTASAAKWVVMDKILTVNKSVGDIQTRKRFMDFQLHAEYRIPGNITGSGQARGNSGIFLAALPQKGGAGGYELQVLDNYNNPTYVNGLVGSIYKQSVPLVNAALSPGKWQTYDVVWTAPRFNEDGSLKSPARVTVLLNGILVQNNFELKGETYYIGQPSYREHGASPIKLQAHGDKSEPISYRNIWIREL